MKPDFDVLKFLVSRYIRANNVLSWSGHQQDIIFNPSKRFTFNEPFAHYIVSFTIRVLSYPHTHTHTHVVHRMHFVVGNSLSPPPTALLNIARCNAQCCNQHNIVERSAVRMRTYSLVKTCIVRSHLLHLFDIHTHTDTYTEKEHHRRLRR